ncbi:MAG: 30S ribosomal protein S28e [Candidatus Micrarchaeota archaeon]|nr:30S ribosomal protein S28e [Candidatus Micrarchaeota archaeon]
MAEQEQAKTEAKGPAEKVEKGAEAQKHFEGYLAEVVDVVGRTGIYGEVKQAMCKILEGKDKGRVIRRNVAGKIYVGDLIRLPDTTREDKPIRAR